MSRSFERLRGDAAANTMVTALVCPAGHKYEITLICMNQLGGVAGQVQVLHVNAALNQQYVEVVGIGSPWPAVALRYDALILQPGEWLQIRSSVTATASLFRWYVAYVDVDYAD